MWQINRILVPTDFSETAEAALDTAIDLAQKFGATVVLMHAYGASSLAYPETEKLAPSTYESAIEQAARDALKNAALSRKDVGIPIATALYSGQPWQEVLVAIEQHEIGLVVMGTRGRSGIAHALLGSVAEKVVRLSPVPVLTLRGPIRQVGA